MLLIGLILCCCVLLGAITHYYYYLMRPAPINIAPSSILHMEWHPATRRERFPSIQERVRLYMSIYYQPHDCKLKKKVKTTTTAEEGAMLVMMLEVKSSGKQFFSRLQLNVPLLLKRNVIHDCMLQSSMRFFSLGSSTTIRNNDNDDDNHQEILGRYCRDIQQDAAILFTEDVPILAQFGNDLVDTSDGVPILAKWRPVAKEMPQVEFDTSSCRIPSLSTITAAGGGGDEQEVYPPIIWNLDLNLKMINNKLRKLDIPWKNKMDKAVWVHGASSNSANQTNACLSDPLCIIVNQHRAVNDDDDDAVMTTTTTGLTVNGKTTDSLLQRYKIWLLDSSDEHDNNNLLWSLSSSSVVIMTPPTRTSWVMEELLQPWVHYIPMTNQSSSALEVAVQWVMNHDQEAHKIAERATLFVYDLFFHPDAVRDNEMIQKEIMRRYVRYWI